MTTAPPRIETLAEHRCFGGVQSFHAFASTATGTTMRFGLYRPPQVLAGARAPTLTWLAGLTCTEETFAIKAGAQRVAAELGLILVTPDTSPRGVELPGDREHWDFGVGAGFYVDAMRDPWRAHYRMFTHVVDELPAVIAAHFPTVPERQSIFGHSMGGHGALVCGLKRAAQYVSVSAFAPIVAPSQVPWGQKAFAGYLGDARDAWRDWDACELVVRQPRRGKLLVDQGLADKFLEGELQPERFEAACAQAGQKLVLRRHDGFDHGYFFIQSFVDDHLRFHAEALGLA
jgi:S-formylglutathione hydrolase